MAYTLQSRTVQESVAPYIAGVIGQTSSTPSRAIINNNASVAITITFADGTGASVFMTKGQVYPIAAIASSADVLYLY